MSTDPRVTIRGLLNRTGLFGASILLAALLVLGFRPPDEAPVDGAGSGATSGTGAGAGTGSGTGSTSTSTTRAAGAGSGSGAGAGSGSEAGAGATAPAATSSTAAATAGGTKTVMGPLESTRYGPVQVEVTIASGKITAVTAVELPSGGRSGSISMYAAPILADEAMTAQSASIDTVSGATYTSRGYAASLQAALDKAGI